jgi:hypothetical protein
MYNAMEIELPSGNKAISLVTPSISVKLVLDSIVIGYTALGYLNFAAVSLC